MKVNGKEILLNSEQPKSLSNLLAEMGIVPETVAIELNGEILEPKSWAITFLKNSDKIEIIKFVGGG